MTITRAAAPLVLLLIAGCPRPAAETGSDAVASGNPAPSGATEAPDDGTTPDPAAAPTADAAGATRGFEDAPHPFTAAQIRDFTKEGRTYLFRVEALGQPLTHREMVFSGVTAEGCTITHRQWTEGGEPKEFPTHTQTWQELYAHSTYPAELTNIVDEEVTVPAGTFACQRYDVLKAGSRLLATRAWFAAELPGAPVKLEAYDQGELQITTVLEKHENPGK